MKFRYPVNYVAITQKFKSTHRGLDLGWNALYGGPNQPIYAAQDGTIIAVKDNDTSKVSWGNYVKIDHGGKIYTLYAHLKKGVAVKKGQKVKMGDLIGYMGNTGNSKGCHLHFEVYEGGSDTKYRVNPITRTYVYPNQKTSSGTKKMTDVLYYTEKPDVLYQAYDNKKKKWLGTITNYNNKNSNGYAGIKGSDIGGLRVKLSDGTKIRIKSHVRGGKWLSEVTKWDNTSNGYSGIKGKPIDAIMIKADKHKIKYRVYANKKWYGWITGYSTKDSNNGYAGVIGKDISAIQIQVVD